MGRKKTKQKRKTQPSFFCARKPRWVFQVWPSFQLAKKNGVNEDRVYFGTSPDLKRSGMTVRTG